MLAVYHWAGSFTIRKSLSGYRFPDDVIALAVRWYLRYRLPYADLAELLAERGILVDPSTIFDWGLFED